MSEVKINRLNCFGNYDMYKAVTYHGYDRSLLDKKFYLSYILYPRKKMMKFLVNSDDYLNFIPESLASVSGCIDDMYHLMVLTVNKGRTVNEYVPYKVTKSSLEAYSIFVKDKNKISVSNTAFKKYKFDGIFDKKGPYIISKGVLEKVGEGFPLKNGDEVYKRATIGKNGVGKKQGISLDYRDVESGKIMYLSSYLEKMSRHLNLKFTLKSAMNIDVVPFDSTIKTNFLDEIKNEGLNILDLEGSADTYISKELILKYMKDLDIPESKSSKFVIRLINDLDENKDSDKYESSRDYIGQNIMESTTISKSVFDTVIYQLLIKSIVVDGKSRGVVKNDYRSIVRVNEEEVVLIDIKQGVVTSEILSNFEFEEKFVSSKIVEGVKLVGSVLVISMEQGGYARFFSSGLNIVCTNDLWIELEEWRYRDSLYSKSDLLEIIDFLSMDVSSDLYIETSFYGVISFINENKSEDDKKINGTKLLEASLELFGNTKKTFLQRDKQSKELFWNPYTKPSIVKMDGKTYVAGSSMIDSGEKTVGTPTMMEVDIVGNFKNFEDLFGLDIFKNKFYTNRPSIYYLAKQIQEYHDREECWFLKGEENER